MWEDTLIASNADLGRKLKSLYGGEVHRIGVSVIYEDPAGKRWLCRSTCSSGIYSKTRTNVQGDRLLWMCMGHTQK